nr:ankyrin repeat domain-containing protein [Luteimonas sp. MC1750]
MYRAAAGGDTELCRELLDGGADVNAHTEEGHNTALHGAAKYGYADICALLLNRGADVDARDASGSTPLHPAAFNHHKDVCQVLIEAGADVSVRSHSGITAADKATTHQNFMSIGEEIRQLIEVAGRRQELKRLSEKGRPEEDLATPEQALERRRSSFMM